MMTRIADSTRFWTAAVCIGGLCVGSTGSSPAATLHRDPMPDIAGRWQSETFILDIMPCGSKFCGQEVISSGCGRTVLSLNKEQPSVKAGTMHGTLDPPGATQRHEAIASVHEGPTGHMLLHIDAYVTPPTLEHRTIPFDADFEWIGPPTCRPAPTS